MYILFTIVLVRIKKNRIQYISCSYLFVLHSDMIIIAIFSLNAVIPKRNNRVLLYIHIYICL